MTLGGAAKPPRRPHPILGWTGYFSPTTYQHRERANLEQRRPVLLYGDSFAACSDGVLCFQDILNTDPEFSAGHYLLNYAVGGYGLDQILLLLQNSVGLTADPFVVVSLFTYDLDRTILSFRVGQKPRLRSVDGVLEPDPTPIYLHATDYLADHPPRATSYLYRKALFGGWLPAGLSATLRGEERHRKQKVELSESILDEILKELRGRNLDFVFLVFHGERASDNPLFGGTDWREEFLLRWFSEHQLPYIWSKEIGAKDRQAGESGSESYIDPEVLHPTEHFNRLIAREISRRALAATGLGSKRQSD